MSSQWQHRLCNMSQSTQRQHLLCLGWYVVLRVQTYAKQLLNTTVSSCAVSSWVAAIYSLVNINQYLCCLISGLCSGGEQCSVSQPATGTTNQDVLYEQDSTAGICVKPKAGGAGCSSGAGMALHLNFCTTFTTGQSWEKSHDVPASGLCIK